MKKLLYSFLFILIVSSCSKDISTDSLFGDWEVTKYKSHVDEKETEAAAGLIFTFSEEGGLQLKKSVNTCFGDYQAEGNGSISLNAGACTEACCDQEWEDQVYGLINMMTDFEIKGSNLELKGDGDIHLIRK